MSWKHEHYVLREDHITKNLHSLKYQCALYFKVT
jgi:hypothetical protein